MLRQPPRALLIDFDGVLRHFASPEPVEKAHDLPAGALLDAAFAWERLRPALAGEISHDEWMASVAAAVGSPAAVAEWQTDRGAVDTAVLDLVRDVRAAGIPVGLATNGTDRLPSDLAALGLTDAFDAVVNSSVVGVHKPAPGFFTAACLAVRVPPRDVLFVDDDDRHIRAARAAKLLAYRWTGPDGHAYVRAALGLA